MPPNWRTQYTRYKNLTLNVAALYKKNPDLRVFLELFLSLGAIIIFAVFALKPTTLTVVGLLGEIKAKEETIAKMDTKIQNLNLAQKTYSRERENIQLLALSLPDKPVPEAFLRQVEAAAALDSVSLLNTTLGETTLLGADETKLAKGDSANLPSQTGAVTFSAAFNSGFDSLMALMAHLENMRRPALVTSLVLAQPTAKEGETTDKLNFTLTGLVPYLKGELNQ